MLKKNTARAVKCAHFLNLKVENIPFTFSSHIFTSRKYKSGQLKAIVHTDIF